MDYNVAAVSLASPPVPAFLTSYRPAIVVKNEGIHDADVSGMLRIYRRSTGLLIFAAPLAVAAVPPGETRQALASDYWTPDEIGDYLVQGFVSTDRDQNPDDNQLPSVTVPVSSEPPPPPPVVAIHATQHEASGTDPINVDGLRGHLAESQSPASHASNHGPGGTDTLSVEGLHGRLADSQQVENHGNDQHTPAMATQSGLSAHDQDPSAHALSTGLEHVARRGVAGGYPSLDVAALVPFDQLGTGGGTPGRFLGNDGTWKAVPAGSFGPAVFSGDAFENAEGVSDDTARADHVHASGGATLVAISSGAKLFGGQFVLAAAKIPGLENGRVFPDMAVAATVALQLKGAAPRTWTWLVDLGNDDDGWTTLLQVSGASGATNVNQPVMATLHFAVLAGAIGHVGAAGEFWSPGAAPNGASPSTAWHIYKSPAVAFDGTHLQYIRVRITTDGDLNNYLSKAAIVATVSPLRDFGL